MTVKVQKPITDLQDVLGIERSASWETVLLCHSIYEPISAAAADRPNATTITFLAKGDPNKEIGKYSADRLMNGCKFSRDDPSIHFHTGGTTGSPKITAHTHGNDIYRAWNTAHF